MHRGLLLLACALSSALVYAQSPRYSVEKLADGVYAVLYNPEIDVEGNTLIVVNDQDVVVVDSNAGTTTARMAIEEIRKLTPKPVTFVVNTHWHDDHVMGNQAYADAYPGVRFIAHPLTRQDIVGHAFANNAYVVDMIAADQIRIAGYLKTGVGRDGTPLTPEARARTQMIYNRRVEMLADRKVFKPVPPTIDVADSLTLTRGSRQIQVRFLGRGNTRGDLVVYLPKEKIVATGDLVVAPIPYATNAYAVEWVKTLDRLMAMPAATILPGHGPVMRDWTYVRKVRGALEQTIAAVAAARNEGLTLPQTVERVQLPELRDSFAGSADLRRRGYEAFFRSSLVRNVWEELDAGVMAAAREASPKEVSNGVYSLGSVTAYVNEKDVVLAQVPGSAAAARGTVRALRELTDKRVTYIVVGTAADAGALAVFREVYAQAEVVTPGTGATITIGDVMTIHREGREIRITRASSGDLAVELRSR